MILSTKAKAEVKAETGSGERPGPSDRTHGKLGRLGDSKRFLWPVVCLFQLGLVAGLYSAWQGSAGRAPAQSDSGAPEAGDNSSSGSQSAADATRGDEFLKRGWYERALARYESSTEGRTGETPGSLRFKVALCLDGLGNWDRAIAEYGEVAARSENDRLSSAARLARARLWFRMRNVEQSKRALCDLLLHSSPESPNGTAALTELSHLLGLTLVMDAAGREPPGPKREAALAYPAFDWRPESLLVWTEAPASESPAAAGRPPAKIDAWPTGPDVQDCDVTLTAHRGMVAEIIRAVAFSPGVTCHWTDAARETASQRPTEVTTGPLPWPVLLTCLTEPLQITWDLRGDNLYLSRVDELDEEQRFAQRVKVAKAILSAIARQSPRNPDAAVADLGLGHLAFAEGQAAEAASWFERFIKECPRSPQTVQAQFDLGVVRRSTGDPDAARAAFLHAIDTSPAHPLASLAHLFVGRIHLDECDPEGAIAPLRRAVSIAAGTTAQSAAVIDLATALMLAESWRSAAAVLAEHRSVIDQPEYREVAAFLATYARYRTLADRKQVHREGQLLVSSLMGIKASSPLAPCGVLLVGRAYAALGLNEQMAETFERALKSGVSKPIAHEISFELAEFAHLSGKSDKASRHFTTVFERAKPARARRAGMRLAEIALSDQRTDDCLRTCRRLLAKSDKADTPEILRLMGKAFEQAGDHQRAAHCFAGQLPPQ